MNLKINSVILASSFLVNCTTDPMNRICDSPNVLYIKILPSNDNPLFDHALNWLSIELYSFPKLRLCMVSLS